MHIGRVNSLLLLVVSSLSFSALAEVPGASHSSLGPKGVTTQTRIICENASYLIEYRSQHGVEGVRLNTFQKTPDAISDEVVQQLSAEFAKFRSINYLDAWCGIEREGEASEFLDLEVRGHYVTSASEAQDKCAAKGWNFDRLTHRKFLVAENNIEVFGNKVGYCSGKMKYFDLKISTSEEENE